MPFHRPIPEQTTGRKASAGLSALMQAETAIQLGLMVPSAVALCWLLGWWADRQFHQHWMAIAGVIFGAVAGLVGVIRMVFRLDGGAETKPDGRPGGGSGTGSA